MRTSYLLAAVVAMLPLSLTEAAPRHERRANAIVRLHKIGARVQIHHLGVDLRGVNFAAEHLDALRELDGVGQLILTGATIAAPQYAQIGQLSGLTELSLANTATTDAHLAALGVVTGLQTLDVCGTQVTPAGIAAFEKVNPNCTVINTKK